MNTAYKKAISKVSILLCLLSLIILWPKEIYGISPPPKGKFPPGFWQKIRQDTTLLKYGDPAWTKRMSQRKLLRTKMARGEITLQALPQDHFIMPVLLGKYSDKDTVYSAEKFQWILFSEDNPTGSLTKYYQEVSYDQFQLTGSVYGWFKVDHPQSYYADDNFGLNSNFPKNSAGFIRDVVAKADPSIDFGWYDNDGHDGVPNSGDDDGYVDVVYVIFPGIGPENFADSSNLWPSASGLGANEYTTNDFSANGGMIKVNAWAITHELLSKDGKTNTYEPIAGFVHEFGHILGLPDLYDTTDDTEPPDFNVSKGLGDWCIMASGGWGGDGNTPSHMSAWCKIRLGWVTPVDQLINGNISILRIEDNPVAFKIWEDGFLLSRYFLVENRQKIGFDKYLPGAGLLIYHVDENRNFGKNSGSGPNNNDETHKLVDLEEADGKDDLDKMENDGDTGDPFPGITNNRIFDDSSVPNTRDYEGNTTGVAIRNISNSGSTMTADINVRSPIGYGILYDSGGIVYITFLYSGDIWCGVLFTAKEPGAIAAVDLGFIQDDMDYELNIYELGLYNILNLKPQKLLYTQKGHEDFAGWNTIPVSSKIMVQKNQNFFVSLKIEKMSFDPFSDYSGRSYWSGDGISYYPAGDRFGPQNYNIRVRIQTQSTESGSVCDFNGDGNKNITDVIALLLFQKNNPGDLKADFNKDGKSNVTDAIAMLLAQRNSTCPDKASSALSSAGDYKQFGMIEGLSAGDIEYLEKLMAQLELTPEETAAFRQALYGNSGKTALPKAFSLSQNSPNPFNPSTTIIFSVPEGSFAVVSLKVYGLQGQLVRTLVNEIKVAGSYHVFWDGRNEKGLQQPSGVYFYRMQAGEFSQTRKMVLVK